MSYFAHTKWSKSKFIPLLLLPFLAGCNMVVINPAGDVAQQESDLIIYATILMLIVVLPVMALTVFFAYKYREANQEAEYDPEWHHSTSLEIVIWTVPMAIIMCLAGLTWVATHRLEPYEPLRRISESMPITEADEPLIIQAIAMDWKWMFIYPEQGVATINEVAAPVNRPIEFQITSSTVMNSLYIPALAGQIYAMSGMQTELNAVINEPGSYEGFSANYSGAGFSQMRFKFHGFEGDGFESWISQVRNSSSELGRNEFLELDKPTVAHPVTHFAKVDDELWNAILNQCVDSKDLCLDDMMVVDAMGGGGIEGLSLRHMFAGICTAEDPAGLFAKVRIENNQLNTHQIQTQRVSG